MDGKKNSDVEGYFKQNIQQNKMYMIWAGFCFKTKFTPRQTFKKFCLKKTRASV